MWFFFFCIFENKQKKNIQIFTSVWFDSSLWSLKKYNIWLYISFRASVIKSVTFFPFYLSLLCIHCIRYFFIYKHWSLLKAGNIFNLLKKKKQLVIILWDLAYKTLTNVQVLDIFCQNVILKFTGSLIGKWIIKKKYKHLE